MPISLLTSSYLNFIRFFASFIVFIGHASMAGLGTHGEWLGKYGHTSVVIFFIMSGYIICRTTIDANRDWLNYSIVRSVRIYSVAIPAIIISIGLSALLLLLVPNISSLDNTYQSFDPLKIISSIFFLNQSWLNNSQLSLNAPYWSLCYEVWYYVIFGCLFFIKKLQYKIITVSILSLFAGPGIMILFPVWLLGVFLACYDKNFYLNNKIYWLISAFSIFLIILIVENSVDMSVQKFMQNNFPFLWILKNSSKFITDYVLGILITIHFFTISHFPDWIKNIIIKLIPLNKFLASFSFTLYLFHDPILRFFIQIFPNPQNSTIHFFSVITLVLITCWLISTRTEAQVLDLRNWIFKKLSIPRN